MNAITFSRIRPRAPGHYLCIIGRCSRPELVHIDEDSGRLWFSGTRLVCPLENVSAGAWWSKRIKVVFPERKDWYERS